MNKYKTNAYALCRLLSRDVPFIRACFRVNILIYYTKGYCVGGFLCGCEFVVVLLFVCLLRLIVEIHSWTEIIAGAWKWSHACAQIATYRMLIIIFTHVYSFVYMYIGEEIVIYVQTKVEKSVPQCADTICTYIYTYVGTNVQIQMCLFEIVYSYLLFLYVCTYVWVYCT